MDSKCHFSPNKTVFEAKNRLFKDNKRLLETLFWTYSQIKLGWRPWGAWNYCLFIRSSPGQSRGIFLLCLFQLLLKVKERQTNVTGRLFIRASCFSTSTIMAIMSTRPLEWDSPSLHLAEWGVAVLKLQLLRTQIRVGTWIAVLPPEYWGDTAFRKWPNNYTIRLIVAKI